MILVHGLAPVATTWRLLRRLLMVDGRTRTVMDPFGYAQDRLHGRGGRFDFLWTNEDCFVRPRWGRGGWGVIVFPGFRPGLLLFKPVGLIHAHASVGMAPDGYGFDAWGYYCLSPAGLLEFF